MNTKIKEIIKGIKRRNRGGTCYDTCRRREFYKRSISGIN